MTKNTPQQASGVKAKCQKCGSQAKSVEYDIVGMVITCSICGKCVYMDRNNQPIEEQQELEETKANIQKSDTPVKAATGTAEIRQGYNLEYQERQPKERSLETAIGELEESEMETETKEVEESKPEIRTSEIEESQMETETKEVEEYELETVTSDAKEYELENVTSEMEEAKMETVTSEAEVEPETVTSKVEETKQPATSTAGEPEMQNDGCPNCGKPKDPKDIRRFQRMALRQCTTCLSWEINPGQKRNPGNQNLAVSIGLQMKFQGASTKEIQEKVNLLTENVQVGKSSMHYWIRRYAKPAIERTRKPQVVNSSGEWELDIISLKYRTQQYYCWSVTDSRTQYILATERTSQLRIGEELFKMAIHAAGQRPQTILLSANMKKDTPGLAEQARTATFIQRSPSEENSNGSMARLRNAVTKWVESARGEFNQETMGYVLGALAMSINLFEQSEQLDDQTPAEAAGVETLYRNWEDMVVKIKATNNPAAPRGSSSKTTAEGQNAAEPAETMTEGQEAAAPVETIAQGQEAAAPVETIAQGQEAAAPVETMTEGQEAAAPVETMAEGQDPAESVETMAEGQDLAGLVETMAEDLDPAESVETMAGERSKTITQELGKVLKELEQHRESLIREHRQVVRDQQAVQRTMEILNKEQPAVNDVSQETAPVA